MTNFPKTFKKNPVEIEALRFEAGNGLAVAEWCGGVYLEVDDVSEPMGVKRSVQIPTLEGTMTASVGDWVIRGVKGEFYPCKPDVFEQTYQEVGENPIHTYERITYRIEARQLTGTLAEFMAVCEWLVEKGYPWLLGNALVPTELRSKGGGTHGIWIDPENGRLYIRFLRDGESRYFNIGARYGDWILFDHPRGLPGVPLVMCDEEFKRKYV